MLKNMSLLTIFTPALTTPGWPGPDRNNKNATRITSRWPQCGRVQSQTLPYPLRKRVPMHFSDDRPGVCVCVCLVATSCCIIQWVVVGWRGEEIREVTTRLCGAVCIGMCVRNKNNNKDSTCWKTLPVTWWRLGYKKVVQYRYSAPPPPPSPQYRNNNNKRGKFLK